MSDVLGRSVLLHCNAGVEIGMGHLMRCLTLGEEAMEQGWSVTIAGELDEAAVKRAHIALPGAAAIPILRSDQRRELPRLVDELGPTIIHVDSYSEEADSLSARDRIVSNMQDGPFGVRPATLSIDANLGAETWFAAPELSQMRLAGETSTIIRNQVTRVRGKWRPAEKPHRVLVVLGGTDPHGFTAAVLDFLELVPVPLSITAVLSSAAAAARETNRASIHEVNVVEYLADLPGSAADHDLVISAAGTSVWDFACAGVPMAIICVTDNQRLGYDAAVTHRLAIGLGQSQDDLWADAAAKVTTMLEDPETLRSLSTRGMDLIDGLGAWRIVSAWNALVDPPAAARLLDVSSRRATPSDARLLFTWRNDPSTRRVSRTQDEIGWEEHVAWLNRVLLDTDRQLYVIERDAEPIGTVRWDHDGGIDWEASISLAPESRGKGLSHSVLAAGEHALFADGPVRYTATIHDENHASRRLFARAGYTPHLPANDSGFAMYSKLRFAVDRSMAQLTHSAQ